MPHSSSMRPSSRESFEKSLEELAGIFRLPLAAPERAKMALLDEMLRSWRRAVGLTGLKSVRERAERYFLEPIGVMRWVPEQGDAIDVGSGGGTPALPFAICLPRLRWRLLEPNRRKAVFLEEACARLVLTNVEVVRARLEEFRCGTEADVVTTRGLALGGKDLHVIAGWLGRGGRLLYFTGNRVAKRLSRERLTDWSVRADVALAPRYDSRLVVLERC